jgi:PKD repeat protein
MIPTASNYPVDFDSDTNLFLVHDSLRLRLVEDYRPGDKSIVVENLPEMLDQFPPSGLITLTEQCGNIDERAVSFYYSAKTPTGFTGLEILPGFKDVAKPKRTTNVTQNVMAAHHNNLKDALIAIEQFVGTKGTVDDNPFGPTMEGRINYLRRLVYTPRAWFTMDKRVGLAPLAVEFKEQAFRLGDGEATFVWDFGDGTNSVVSFTPTVTTVVRPLLPEGSPLIHVTETVPLEATGVFVQDDNAGAVTKTYAHPGIYDVKLTVTNENGSDTVIFEECVTVRSPAPDEAQINFVPRAGQNSLPGDTLPKMFERLGTLPGGPFTVPPTVRAGANTFIDIEIPVGNIEDDRTYAGELLNANGNPIDPIVSYTWSLGDDLMHPTTRHARASFSIGGIYDLKVRTDTSFGSFRITTYENAIDIIERRNLWLFTLGGGNNAKAHEFGLLSETFKTADKTLSVVRDDNFLNGIGAFDPTSNTYPAEIRAKREFKRNTGFAQVTTTPSGEHGTALLLWAGGGPSGSPLNAQQVKSAEYEGFGDVYTATGLTITRPWNWVFLPAPNKGYLVFGPHPAEPPNDNLSIQTKTTINYSPSFSATNTTLGAGNYLSGAGELQNHVTSGYTDNEPDSGRFAVYRSAWKGQTGYIIRNGGAGTFFRLNNFYKTEGTIVEPVMNFKKLPDVTGSTKVEGQLVGMADGVFFFNNTGNIAAFNDVTGTWQVGGPSAGSATFRSVQDSTAADFDNPSNTLLAASDGDRIAYLSFDYSPNAFIRFNTADLTFLNLGARPSGEQWILGCY